MLAVTSVIVALGLWALGILVLNLNF